MIPPPNHSTYEPKWLLNDQLRVAFAGNAVTRAILQCRQHWSTGNIVPQELQPSIQSMIHFCCLLAFPSGHPPQFCCICGWPNIFPPPPCPNHTCRRFMILPLIRPHRDWRENFNFGPCQRAGWCEFCNQCIGIWGRPWRCFLFQLGWFVIGGWGSQSIFWCSGYHSLGRWSRHGGVAFGSVDSAILGVDEFRHESRWWSDDNGKLWWRESTNGIWCYHHPSPWFLH